MSCDAHLYLEMKKDDQWHFMEELDVTQDYDLFGLLAGVRGSACDHTEVRGMPRDMSVGLQHHAQGWLADAHHATWYTPHELLGVLAVYEEMRGKQHHLWDDVLDARNEYDDCRFVLWFDN